MTLDLTHLRQLETEATPGRTLAAAAVDLPASVAQEAGDFYESYAAHNPDCTKREAMAHAWEQVLRPYLWGRRDHSAAQTRPPAPSWSLVAVEDAKGFVTLHEPDEDRRAGDLVASVWRDDWLPSLSSATPPQLEGRWLPIEQAPYKVPVEIRVGRMKFEAMLVPDASMSDVDTSCDQWQAVHEGEHPPCWSGGACWASNEDEVMSLQPTAFRPLPTPPVMGEGA